MCPPWILRSSARSMVCIVCNQALIELAEKRLMVRCPTVFPAGLRVRVGGVSEGIRTPGRWSHNPELYQLSYAHHTYSETEKPTRCPVCGRISGHAIGGNDSISPTRTQPKSSLHPAQTSQIKARLGKGKLSAFGGCTPSRIRTCDPLLRSSFRLVESTNILRFWPGYGSVERQSHATSAQPENANPSI
jgi:hypothetical protein